MCAPTSRIGFIAWAIGLRTSYLFICWQFMFWPFGKEDECKMNLISAANYTSERGLQPYRCSWRPKLALSPRRGGILVSPASSSPFGEVRKLVTMSRKPVASELENIEARKSVASLRLQSAEIPENATASDSIGGSGGVRTLLRTEVRAPALQD